MRVIRLKEEHPHYQKLNELVTKAVELGISLQFTNAGPIMRVEGDDREFTVIGTDEYLHGDWRDPIRDFPPQFEVKILYEKEDPE